MLSLFQSGSVVIITDFRIAFSECLTTHCKIHTNFGTFPFKVGTKVCDDVFSGLSGSTDHESGAHLISQGLPDFKETRIKLVTTTDIPEIFATLDYIAEKWGNVEMEGAESVYGL